MKYTVNLTCNTPAYSSVEVEADSADEALAIVRADIAQNGWGCRAWQDGVWEPDWSGAEGLVVTGAEVTNG